MDFIAEDISNYAEFYSEKEPDVLQELSRETNLKILNPRMLSGHLQGRFLSFLSRLKQPEKILEIGTYTGYSAICMAEGLKSEGRITTIDCNEELESFTRSFFDKAAVSDKIDFLIGDALEIIPTLNDSFDLVFIDADKENYLNYYHLVKNKVKSGGLIIADNVLWSGKVLDQEIQDEDTEALRKYVKFVSSDADVTPLLLPLRDGLMVAMKK